MKKDTIGRIYKITTPHTNKCYIGSTRRTITQRFNGHKEKNNICSSKELIELGDSIIELLEEVQDINNLQLRILEQKYIDTNNCINIKNAIYNKLEYDREYHRKRRRNMKSSWITL